MKTTRRPPKPPFADSPKGTCRLCGALIMTLAGKPDQRRNWCDICAKKWRVANNPEVARAALFLRDIGCCAMCGSDGTSYAAVFDGQPYTVQLDRVHLWQACLKVARGRQKRASSLLPPLGKWDADHIVPLWSLDDERQQVLGYWGLDNLQTLCPSCHAKKTDREAAQRAKVKRLEGERLGTKKPRAKRKIAVRANPWPPKGARKMAGRAAS